MSNSIIVITLSTTQHSGYYTLKACSHSHEINTQCRIKPPCHTITVIQKRRTLLYTILSTNSETHIQMKWKHHQTVTRIK